MPELWCLTVDTIQLAPLIESLDSSDDLSVTSLGRCLERCTFDIEELVKLVEDVKAKEGISYDRRVAHRTETYEMRSFDGLRAPPRTSTAMVTLSVHSPSSRGEPRSTSMTSQGVTFVHATMKYRRHRPQSIRPSSSDREC